MSMQTALFEVPVAGPSSKSKVLMSPVDKTNGEPTTGEIIDFIRRRCILPESRRSIELHGYQLELIEMWNDPSAKADVAVIAAGNAKTTTLGAFLTAHIFLSYEASVPVVADTVTQAVITTWGKVKRFVELDPELLARAEVLEGQGSRRGIYVPGLGSHCFPIADKPSGLQGLNPSIAALEEMSESSVKTFGALMNRLGKRGDRLNKVVGISTPSFTPDNALLTVQRAFHSGQPPEGVRLKEHVSDQKDHLDESQWPKANPGLAPGVIKVDAIRADLVLPEQQFRAYRLCQQPVGGVSCWLNRIEEDGEEVADGFDVWKAAARPAQMASGAPTWVGVDVAKSNDHAAVVWGQRRADDPTVLHTKAKIWTPTETAAIDLDDIASHLEYLRTNFELEAVWFDPSYFDNAAELDEDGFPMVAIPPTPQRMAPLCGHAYRSIRRGLVTHDAHEQYTMHVLAGARRYTPNGFTIEKRHYANKCDAAIALVLCHGAAHAIDPDGYTPDSFKIK